MSYHVTNATRKYYYGLAEGLRKSHNDAKDRAVISNDAQSLNSEDVSLSIICLIYVKIIFLVMSPEI